jgi:hypothetical protein
MDTALDPIDKAIIIAFPQGGSRVVEEHARRIVEGS